MCGRTTHASDRHPDRGRRARRLDRGRHAGPHRLTQRCWSIRMRSIRRTSAPRSSTARRSRCCARPVWATRCCARRRLMAKAGSRALAGCSRSGRATSTASCTTRWSTRCVARSRRAWTSSTPRSWMSRRARTARPSRSRPANRFPHALSWWRMDSMSGLRHKLGMERRDISKTHSIMLGFDLVPGGAELFVSGAHLLRRASVGPHRLHHAVSDWRDDAREPLRLSRAGRSVAEAVPRCIRARRCRR